MEAVSEHLPEQTGDDTDLGWGDAPTSFDDAYYLNDKPPHWG